MHRRILHIDMDAFFASVEQRDNPELRGRPIVVGGRPGGRGVVAAASYEARAFGVRSAMPASRAARLCPDLIFVKPRFSRYKEVSGHIFSIFRRWSDQVEGLSLDEAFVDATDNRFGEPSGTRVAQAIRQAIRQETGLTASAGVAPVKFVAKIASDFNKPDGLTVVPPDQVLAFIHPLPVEKLWGVGPATAERLHAVGLRTIGQIHERPEHLLIEQLGRRTGTWLATLARGEDPRPVRQRKGRKSVSAERTFAEDVHSVTELEATLAEQAERVASTLGSKGLWAGTVVLKLRYEDFSTITRSLTPPRPVCSAEELLAAGMDLLGRTEAGQRPVRLIGLGASKLGGAPSQPERRQLDLPLSSPASRASTMG